MNQAELKSSGAAQTLPNCTVEAEQDGLNAWLPEIELPLEGLSPEEVDLSMAAVKFLCVLIESYVMTDVEKAAPSNNFQEIHRVLAAN